MTLLSLVGENWKFSSTRRYILHIHTILGKRDWWRTQTGGLDVLFPKEEILSQ
jgi:hypothetical protein